MDIERQQIEWDIEKVNRLWDYKGTLNTEEEYYFGYQVGGAVVKFCEYISPKSLKQCNVLDYGCGKGHIIGYFLRKGIQISGVDMSEEEVKIVDKKYKKNSNFKGVKLFDGEKLPFSDNEFDLITCTECIEHVLDMHMSTFLSELYRVQKKDGVILITTPNEENIQKSQICCPNCNTVYHPQGHVRSFSSYTLTDLMEKYRYKTVLCGGTDFNHIQRMITKPNLLDMSIRQIIKRAERAVDGFVHVKGRGTMDDVLFQRYMHLNRQPHLVYVGKK